MVNNSSNRSPSPISMRPNPNPNFNPNSRSNQEKEGVSVRKSFSGYPFAKSSINSQPKSFNPNTPVNSPAEYARRSSFGKECGVSFGDHDQKENERDPNSKPGKVRSPSISKGAKNFMSPTISAASKINPSPRKKVLGERNEAIRTSASLSDGKFHFYSSNSLEFADENETKLGMETPPCSTKLDFNKLNNEVYNTELEKKVAEMSPGVGKNESEPDLVVLSPEIPFTKSSETLPLSDMPKIVAENNVGLVGKKPSDSSPSVVAPLDADPFYQPYDPKTNFLSPRPQFLHYKPNPRIESYINQGIRLEDDLASESVSETETSEDIQSEEAASSVGTSVVEEELPSSEMSSPKSEQLEDTVGVETDEPRSWFAGKWKSVCLLFLILLGSITFSMHSPGVGNALFQDKILSEIYNNPRVAAVLAKENINDLLTYTKVWTAQSVGYLLQMIYKEREIKFSPLPFSNLTGWQEEEFEDYMIEAFELVPTFDKIEGRFVTDMGKYPKIVRHESFAEETALIELDESEIMEESSVILPVYDQEIEASEPDIVEECSMLEGEHSAVEVKENPSLLDELENQESVHKHEEYDITPAGLLLADQVMETSEPEKLEVISVLEDSVIADEHYAVEVSEISESEKKHEDYDTASAVQYESQSDSMVEHSAVEISERPSFFDEPEISGSEKKPEDYDTASAVQYESQSDSLVEDSIVRPQVTTANEPLSETLVESSEKNLVPLAAAISAVVVSLGLAAMAVVFLKKPKKETSVVSTPLAANIIQEEKSKCMPTASYIDSKADAPSSLSSPAEVDVIGESCASEMSSFQKTSSYYNKRDLRGCDEAQSEERNSKRNSKRESLASSSSEYTMSASYGSFTTYSILPSKHRDDEVVTPVRRSSRIRSKVTSP